MTRQEMINLAIDEHDCKYSEELIGCILDEINSRTCDNCSYFRDNFRTCNLLGDLIESPSVMKCNSHEKDNK